MLTPFDCRRRLQERLTWPRQALKLGPYIHTGRGAVRTMRAALKGLGVL